MASIWRSENRPAISWDDSTELVQRAAAVQIIEQLPSAIIDVHAVWAGRDADWALARNRPAIGTTLKAVNPSSVFLAGVDMQLQDPDIFPAISIRCGNSIPAEDREQGDQFDQLENTLTIEIWAVIGPYTEALSDHSNLEEIDRIIHRLTSAVRLAINFDRSLGETTMGIRRPPRARFALPFVMKSTAQNIGGSYLAQAAELTYTVSALSY
jgi:hypothetical protein